MPVASSLWWAISLPEVIVRRTGAGTRSRPSTNPLHVVLASVSLTSTSLPLDQGADRRAVAGALDQISFPVSRDQPTLDLRRALMDARHVADLAALLVGLGPSSAMRLALPKTSQQLLLQLPAWQGMDRLIDRLTASPEDASPSSSRRFLRPEICSGRWRNRAATASNCPASADLGGRRAARPRSG